MERRRGTRGRWQPGDVVECHRATQRVTYEFGSYALVRADAG